MKAGISTIRGVARASQVAAELLTRFTVGFVFLQSGYGKLTHLPRTIEYFASLGIPMAQTQAPIAAATELGCGALLILGLATRFAAVPLMVIMVVAIRTAKWDEAADLSSLFGMSEFLYLVLLIWLLAQGAGKVSIDSWLTRKFCGKLCNGNRG